MLYNMENTAMFYKDRKWTMTFAICESLYCTPVTYNIVYHLYFSLKKKKKECLQFPRLSDKCTQVGKVNGRLFQKIGFEEDIKDESSELPSEESEEEITLDEVIDEKGELI